MRLKAIMIFLSVMAWTAVGMAQKSESKQINMIKLDGRYLYAEATMPTEAEAREAADIMLINYINDKFKEHHIDRRLGLDGLEQAQYITVKRGTNIRVFAYVESSAYGIPSTASQQPVQTPEPTPSPAREASPAPQAAPAATPKASATTAPGPAAAPETRRIAGSAELSAWQNEAIEDLLGTKNLNEAAQLLNEFRSARKVLAFGSPKECRDAAMCYWIVFDNNLNTITVLSNGQNDVRHNFKTGATEGLSAYSGGTAIWFLLSK